METGATETGHSQPPPVTKTRRRLLAGGAAIAGGLLSTACGDPTFLPGFIENITKNIPKVEDLTDPAKLAQKGQQTEKEGREKLLNTLFISRIADQTVQIEGWEYILPNGDDARRAQDMIRAGYLPGLLQLLDPRDNQAWLYVKSLGKHLEDKIFFNNINKTIGEKLRIQLYPNNEQWVKSVSPRALYTRKVPLMDGEPIQNEDRIIPGEVLPILASVDVDYQDRIETYGIPKIPLGGDPKNGVWGFIPMETKRKAYSYPEKHLVIVPAPVSGNP